MTTCVKCGKPITGDDPLWVWYHADSGLPPCDPSQVDPDAYSDIEGDKYDIATPEDDADDEDADAMYYGDPDTWEDGR